MKVRIGMIVVAGSMAWFSACGSDNEASENPNRGAGGSRAAEPAMCPVDRPMNGATCPERGLTCPFEGGDCTCETDSMGAFGAIAWDCPVNLRAQMCPMAEPEAGSACTTIFGECEYGDSKVCDCADETDTWACWNPADCPAAAPANMSSCEVVGMECEYEDTMTDCDCTPEGWDCEMDPF